MELTLDTFEIYAAKHYDNPYCFNEQEFQSDLAKIATIKRMIAWDNSGQKIDVHKLVNNVISFYNVFDHHAASELIRVKITEDHLYKINAVLYFLSLPLVVPEKFDVVFHRRIAQEFRNL